MIPQKHEGGVEVDGLSGERSKFTIAATGKAFRVLIDGLYSNKIQAVTRELWSNAADSHVAAGKRDVPFHVSVPTCMDPTFRVRDFGTSLDHDDVMHLYTTLFQSSKDDTNEQTGMLGLGSKSPFAYTDTFSVVAWKDGVKRVYVANIGSDGVPAITFITSAASDEPQGIEVSFPVVRGDINIFHREAQWVSMGFDPKPVVDGMTLKMAEPRLSGPNWAIYPSGSFGDAVRSKHLIRQGVACYPNDAIPVAGLGYNWITIVDVPIGTADVTASREALSYTNSTKAAVQQIVHEVGADIMLQVKAEVAKAKTRREIAQAHLEFNGVFSNQIGRTTVSLLDNDGYRDVIQDGQVVPMVRRAGDTVLVAKEYGKNRKYAKREVSSEDVHVLDKVKILIDDTAALPKKFVRKASRIASFTRSSPTVFIVPAVYDGKGREIAVSWVKQCWELDDSQFFKMSDIPDPGPTKAPIGRTPVAKKELAQGQFWMVRKAGSCTSEIYGEGSARDNSLGWPGAMIVAFKALGKCKVQEAQANILYVTPLQAERMGLPKNRMYDVAVQKELSKQASALPLDDAIAVFELSLNLNGVPLTVVREQFFQHLTLSVQDANAIINKAKIAKIDLQNRLVTDKVKSQIRLLSASYPLMFGHTSKVVFEQYVQQVQAAAKAEEVIPA